MEKTFDPLHFYEKVSSVYDRDTHPQIFEPTSEYERRFAGIVAGLKPSSILEIGTGTGKRLRSILSYYDSLGLELPRICATDPLPAMIERIPADVQKRVELRAAEETSAFADDSFDLVLTSGVLCSVHNHVAAAIAKESHRICKYFSMHTDTPKDRPHLNDLDILGFFLGAGCEVVFWSTLHPYPIAGEREAQIIVAKTRGASFSASFPLRSFQEKYESGWEELLRKRIEA